MQDYSKITDELNNISRRMKAHNRVFSQFLSNIEGFNGRVPQLKHLDIAINEKEIAIKFHEQELFVSSEFKPNSPESENEIVIFKKHEGNSNQTLSKCFFDTSGKVNESDLSMMDDIEAMAILLNLVKQAL
ncbi:hypothetical protein [Pseudoalteromonas sp. R86517]|jgi:hypothetical protein|uniref:hypothetical protein n=1 Tax=Pseudoalteromonas sp. R86517 TaxID=3093857 RepID=UPI00366E1C2B